MKRGGGSDRRGWCPGGWIITGYTELIESKIHAQCRVESSVVEASEVASRRGEDRIKGMIQALNEGGPWII